jgi:hypothetical protein
MFPAADAIIKWLLEGDPSIRWQVQRDLLDAPRKTWEAERACVATEGWGAELLKRQDRKGTWGGGIYSPKWKSTTYTLLLLRDMGLPPGNAAAVRGCRLILDRALASKDDPTKLRDLSNAGCTCMMGMWLALPAYFGVDDPKLAALAEHVLTQHMPDGGWNCRLGRRRHGPVHSSFHTTLNVLDGVREAIARRIGPLKKLREAEARAVELLLQHRLYKSDKTGRIIHRHFARVSFPHRWHYDFLRGLDYIRTTPFIRDARLGDAFELLLGQRRPDGRWPLGQTYGGEVFFNMETPGQPSRWNTLRALRCMKARGSRADYAPTTRARPLRAPPTLPRGA